MLTGAEISVQSWYRMAIRQSGSDAPGGAVSGSVWGK